MTFDQTHQAPTASGVTGLVVPGTDRVIARYRPSHFRWQPSHPSIAAIGKCSTCHFAAKWTLLSTTTNYRRAMCDECQEAYLLQQTLKNLRQAIRGRRS